MKTRITSLSLLLFISAIERLDASIVDTIIGAVNNGASGAFALTSTPSTSPSRTLWPSVSPSLQPSSSPSAIPSHNPSSSPSSGPSGLPSSVPSGDPSSRPSTHPSSSPTYLPTSSPSISPSYLPTGIPSVQPSRFPSMNPSFNLEKLSATKYDQDTQDGKGAKSEIDHEFFIMLASCVAGFAVFTTLAAIYIVRRNRNNSFDMLQSVKVDDYSMPDREPEPLPATRSILRQFSNQLSAPIKRPTTRNFHIDAGAGNTSSFVEDLSYGGDISVFDPSTIQTEKTSVWGRRLERDASYDIESRPSMMSEFVLPSVFDPSTIRTEGSMAKRTAISKKFEGLQFFNDEPIPDQIFCIDEEE